MKGFLPLFLHEYKKPSFNSKYKYMDVSDGIAYTRTLKEMEDNFKRLHPDNEENKPIIFCVIAILGWRSDFEKEDFGN